MKSAIVRGDITRKTLGQPTDGSLADGYIVGWTPQTRVVDAIDDLNEGLLYLLRFGGLAGPPGLDGEEGPEGPAGPSGSTGANGAGGPQGPPGLDGIDGIDGVDGTSGVSAHHLLNGLIAYDDHTQYAILAGRAGGQTLIGGTEANEKLTLQATAHATRTTSTVRLSVDTNAYMEIQATRQTFGSAIVELEFLATQVDLTNLLDTPVVRFTDASARVFPSIEFATGVMRSNDTINLIYTSQTFTFAPYLIDTASTITLDFANANIQAYHFAPTVVLKQPGGIFSTALLFNANMTMKNDPAYAGTMSYGPVYGFIAQPVIQADTKTIIQSIQREFVGQTTFNVINGGVLTVGEWSQVDLFGVVSSGVTVTTRRGVRIENPSIGGTITTQIGVDIEVLSGAGTNIGIRNASSLRQIGGAMFGVAAANTALVHIQAQSLGIEVLRLESVAANDAPRESVYQNRLATIDATANQTLHTFAIPTSTTVMIEVNVIAKRSTTETGAGYKLIATYKNVAGAVTLIGAVATTLSAEDVAGWDCNLAISGTNVLCRVTGAAASNITWHMTARTWQVST
jgi:hypothetical protein